MAQGVHAELKEVRLEMHICALSTAEWPLELRAGTSHLGRKIGVGRRKPAMLPEERWWRVIP